MHFFLKTLQLLNGTKLKEILFSFLNFKLRLLIRTNLYKKYFPHIKNRFFIVYFLHFISYFPLGESYPFFCYQIVDLSIFYRLVCNIAWCYFLIFENVRGETNFLGKSALNNNPMQIYIFSCNINHLQDIYN